MILKNSLSMPQKSPQNDTVFGDLQGNDENVIPFKPLDDANFERNAVFTETSKDETSSNTTRSKATKNEKSLAEHAGGEIVKSEKSPQKTPSNQNSLNETPQGERLHVSLFGRRNAGKSSLLNAITGQDIAVVSPIKGTTTDPVSKAMELAPIGAVLLTDTAGIDDDGELGLLRIEKTKSILRKTDIALLVVDAREGLADEDKTLLNAFKQLGVKYLIVHNKCDLISSAFEGANLNSRFNSSECMNIKDCEKSSECEGSNKCCISVDNADSYKDTKIYRGESGHKSVSECEKSSTIYASAKSGENICQLKEKIAQLCSHTENKTRLVADLISSGDVVVLVTPIDKSAPKGRLILPQQQVIRDILEVGAIAVVATDGEFEGALAKLKNPPRLVITDSQVFDKISKLTLPSVLLTSFSILMARYKGFLMDAAEAAKTLDTITKNDKILISEGCTHHRQCEDIGTVKLPKWIADYRGERPIFEFSSGGDFPADLSKYKLIIHCGGCMLNSREMLYRKRSAFEANVPMTNYGIAISFMQGILPRCLNALKPCK